MSAGNSAVFDHAAKDATTTGFPEKAIVASFIFLVPATSASVKLTLASDTRPWNQP